MNRRIKKKKMKQKEKALMEKNFISLFWLVLRELYQRSLNLIVGFATKCLKLLRVWIGIQF